MTIPVIELNQLLQPISAAIRDSLITTNPKLRDVNFAYLQAYVPPTTITEDTLRIQILVQPSASSIYKLLSNQVFTFARTEAHDVLTYLGLEERVFAKEKYEEVTSFLSKFGTFTVLEGNPTNPKGNAIVAFNFGERLDETIQARWIDLGQDIHRKEEYDVFFKGVVKFTFEGEPVEEGVVDEQLDEPMEDRSDYLNVADLFKNRSLGSIFKGAMRPQ